MAPFDPEHVRDEVGAEVGYRRDELNVEPSEFYTGMGAGTVYEVWHAMRTGGSRVWFAVRDHEQMRAVALATTKHHLRDLFPRDFWQLYKDDVDPDRARRMFPEAALGAVVHVTADPTNGDVDRLAKAIVGRHGAKSAFAIGRHDYRETPSGFVYWAP